MKSSGSLKGRLNSAFKSSGDWKTAAIKKEAERQKAASKADSEKETQWRKARLTQLKAHCEKAWKSQVGERVEVASKLGTEAKGWLISVSNDVVHVSESILDEGTRLERAELTDESQALCYKDSFIDYYSAKQLEREAAAKPWRRK